MNIPLQQYKADIEERVSTYKHNTNLQNTCQAFFNEIGVGKANYVYNFTWLGLPIIQIPQDLQALQEIIWEAKPDLIIETGIAWGGSLIFSASMLAILEACGEIQNGKVIGIDVDIRPHNLKSINEHPLAKKIQMLEGSSIDKKIIDKVKIYAKQHKRVLVCLDSNHTHEHVLAELEAYAPLVTVGSYCMVGDTVIEDAPDSMSSARPWNKGNSPKTAVWEFLRRIKNDKYYDENGASIDFIIDSTIEHKIVLTGSPDGYLKRI